MATPGDEKPIVCYETSYKTMATVLDSLDALVYVSDFHTHELLFLNRRGRELFGDSVGRHCWEVLQSEQNGPCAFCTNTYLRDADGKSTGVYVWEFQNTVNHRWYECRDEAIEWVDGRLVRIEIATDITERKAVHEAMLLAKEEAEKLARTDALTTLYNRRAFLEEGKRILAESRRFGQSVSMAVFDVDFFKKVNDTYGHSAGDAVLRKLAKVLKNALREIDVVARIGGEEFAIIFPYTDLVNAISVVERLRNKIDKTTFGFNGTSIHVTASFGIVERSQHEHDMDAMLHKADELLYQAKRYGRNRVESAPGEG